LDSSILEGFEGGECSLRTGLPGESIEKEMVKKMERFPKVFSVQVQLMCEKGKRVENKRRLR